MVISATFAACFGLCWIPEPPELAGNKGLGQDGSINGHPCERTPLKMASATLLRRKEITRP